MKTLYQAANAVEAHMILHLLKQDGITGHVLGEHLQGAVGELPAAGLVRVTVDEADYERGRALIEAWEASMPPEPVGVAAQKQVATQRGVGWKMLLLGLAIGVVGTYGVYRVPARQQALDHDGNGVPDETWTQAINGRGLDYKADRNLDGQPDYIGHFDRKGVMTEAHSDDDFNGTPETRTTFVHNQPAVSESDTDGDGYPDLVTVFRHGVAREVRYLSPITGKPLRVEYLSLGKLTHAEVDADQDGQLETRWRYGPDGAVVARERMGSVDAL